MKSKIRLKNIQLFGHHGIESKEKDIGQKFEIDIVAYTNFVNAINTDDINETVDYSAMYDKVVDVFLAKRYNLIETLANQIASSLITDFLLSDCKVIIRKPDVPINGILDAVEVEIFLHG